MCVGLNGHIKCVEDDIRPRHELCDENQCQVGESCNQLNSHKPSCVVHEEKLETRPLDIRPSTWYDQGKVVPSLGNCPTIECDRMRPAESNIFARPTIQKIQKLHIRILRRLVGNGLDGRGFLIDGIKGGLGEIRGRELVEIEKIGVGELRGELGVREESQLLIEVEQVLLLALLHRLVVG